MSLVYMEEYRATGEYVPEQVLGILEDNETINEAAERLLKIRFKDEEDLMAYFKNTPGKPSWFGCGIYVKD